MEIRNAVFQGDFNKLIHDLSETKVFRNLWNIPLDDADMLEKNNLYRKMEDVELVLRFFALFNYDRMDMKFRDYLGDFMDGRNKEYVTDVGLKEVDTTLFMRSASNCWSVFGEDAFRKPSEQGLQSSKSAPLADAVMIALAEIDPAIAMANREPIRTAIHDLCLHSEDFKKAVGTGTNGKGAIRMRIELARDAVRAAIPQ